jgi:K(+)-stimulated pyrophosphate-energized sodium pump
MVLASLGSYYLNRITSTARYGGKKNFNWESPLTELVWTTSIVSIVVCFARANYCWVISRFPQMVNGVLTDVPLIEPLVGAFRHHRLRHAGRRLDHGVHQDFRQHQSRHVREVTHSSEQGGASLNILSGLVAGNFSAFWMGLVILALMFAAYLFSQNADLLALMPPQFTFAAPIFAFGLVAFGFLAMAPVTIAVDSFGPGHGQRPVGL